MMSSYDTGILNRSTGLALSDEERKALRDEIQAELESEHLAREKRAQRKIESRDPELTKRPKDKKAEIKAIKMQLRRDFYETNGYKLQKDPTGRDMWLSPSEQEIRKSRNRNKRNSKHKKSFLKVHRNNLVMYSIIMAMAVVIGLFIVKKMS